MSRSWRLPCPECDTDYRKMHHEVDGLEAARALDVRAGQLDEAKTFVRCNNCRDVHSVRNTRKLDVQAGVGR